MSRRFDILVIGAGLSGIGAAYHLQKYCPGKTYAILESRSALGGTWDLYRYPGIRSDSDMHTLGYGFKPWREAKAIADGPSILEYVNETADENHIREHILFNRRLESASWSSDEACWTTEVVCTDGAGGTESIRCGFLLMCSGYYSYEEPHRPHFEGEEDFEGPMFHPQLWPDGLDYKGKRVVVIGSGATAMTLVPAMTDEAEHVTMLQRSPTWVFAFPDRDVVANALRKVLPDSLAYAITRFKNTRLQHWFYRRTRTAPEKVKKFLLGRVRKNLGPDFDVGKHFTPTYGPWDQRLCLIANGDLYRAINSGKVSVVTEQIERITKKGVRLETGDDLEADIIISATGLNMKLMGGARFSVDGEPVDFSETYTYKGMMVSDVPNLVQTFGYINASWTLRADLTAEYTCRLINRMHELGMRQCTPRLRDEDRGMPARPWIEDFSSGYMQRVMHLLPKQGDREPWLNTQDFFADKKMIRDAPLEDGALEFDNPGPALGPYVSIVEPQTELRRKFARACSLVAVKRNFDARKPIAVQRAAFTRLARLYRAPRGITVSRTRVGGVPCMRLENPAARGQRTILYLHGGGYVLGSSRLVSELGGRLALAADAHALLPDYALAPEHPYPAAIDECVSIYQALLESGVSARELTVGGDSAGGCLTALLAQRLRDAGAELPACLYLISPNTDLSRSGDSILSKAHLDAMLSPEWLEQVSRAYLGDASPRDPAVSPLFADHTSLPPTFIQVGRDEMLLSDAERYAARSFDAGVDVTLEIWNGLWHDFQLFGSLIPEASDALTRAGRFIRSHSD